MVILFKLNPGPSARCQNSLIPSVPRYIKIDESCSTESRAVAWSTFSWMTRSLKPVEEACSLNSSGLCLVSLLSIFFLEFEECQFITSKHDEYSGLPKLGPRRRVTPEDQVSKTEYVWCSSFSIKEIGFPFLQWHYGIYPVVRL